MIKNNPNDHPWRIKIDERDRGAWLYATRRLEQEGLQIKWWARYNLVETLPQ